MKIVSKVITPALLCTITIGCATDSEELITDDPVTEWHALSQASGKDDSLTARFAYRGDVCHGATLGITECPDTALCVLPENGFAYECTDRGLFTGAARFNTWTLHLDKPARVHLELTTYDPAAAKTNVEVYENRARVGSYMLLTEDYDGIAGNLGKFITWSGYSNTDGEGRTVISRDLAPGTYRVSARNFKTIAGYQRVWLSAVCADGEACPMTNRP